MEIALLVTGIVVGGVIGWIVSRFRLSEERQASRTTILIEQEKNKALQAQTNQYKSQLESEQARVLRLNSELASTEADYRNLQEKLHDQKKELESVHDKFTAHFRNLANEILEEKTKKFTEQNKTGLFDLLKPLGEKIQQFEKKVEETHIDNVTRNAALREQLENLQRLNLQMTREAENLTRALRGDSKTQGAWGEFILESILQKSGLEKDREYFIQESFTTEEGRFRPDVVIRLPENRYVIIDSKVSLTGYNNFVNSSTEEEKALALKGHLVSIRQHLRGLGEKNYHKHVLSDSTLDFIIMFIPIEPAYILAIQTEKDLYEEALNRRIVFVSPTLLIPSLQLIKNVWKQEYQNRHVLEIANKAGDLYDKFVGFTEDLIRLGQLMDSSKKFYEESMKKLSVGSGNLVRRVEELKKLGAKTSKNMDPKLLNRSEDQTDLFN
ncbi:MAG TPA: DNA recombination protein RmuC [Chryseosolibacter sp.]|nr:DNA recombination protein RmuC [Chryseosolibacter sp.]